MPPPCLPGFSAFLKPFEGVLAYRFQHPVTRGPFRQRSHHERLIHQPPEQVEHVLGTNTSVDANGLRRLQSKTAGEDRQPAEELLLRSVQQVVAPIQRSPYGALPLGQVPRPAARERLLQPRENRGRI